MTRVPGSVLMLFLRPIGQNDYSVLEGKEPIGTDPVRW
jgi:hypothetical protein